VATAPVRRGGVLSLLIVCREHDESRQRSVKNSYGKATAVAPSLTLPLGVLFIWLVQFTTSGNPGMPESWLLDSDPAVKQILLTMNEKQTFIIEDLDDYHLVIKSDEEYRVRQELEVEVCLLCLFVARLFHLGPQLEKNTYSLEV
jgi:TFIIH basal transcription factor complex TTD-A subunit